MWKIFGTSKYTFYDQVLKPLYWSKISVSPLSEFCVHWQMPEDLSVVTCLVLSLSLKFESSISVTGSANSDSVETEWALTEEY